MALPVDVESVEALEDVRAAIVTFGEDIRHALDAMQMEIRRMTDWLSHEQRMLWTNEIKRRREQMAQAKSEWDRKKLSGMFGQHANASESRDMFREHKQRMETAEKKLETVRRWLPKLEHAVHEYQSQARPLADLVDGDLERALEELRRMIRALEEYSRLKAPSPREQGAFVSAAAQAPTTTAPPDAAANADSEPRDESASETDESSP